MSGSRVQDILAILRGAKIVSEAAIKEHERYLKHVWSNSSVKEIVDGNIKSTKDCVTKFSQNPSQELNNILNAAKETYERSSVVVTGIQQLAKISIIKSDQTKKDISFDTDVTDTITAETTETKSKIKSDMNLDISSITLKELEEILSKKYKTRIRLEKQGKVNEASKSTPPTPQPQSSSKPDPIKTAANDQKISTVAKSHQQDEALVENFMKTLTGTSSAAQHSTGTQLQQLSVVAKQRKVPASRVGRMASFGGLFAGLGFGTVSELTKGALGFGGAKNVKDAFLSPANAERIVDTLCRVRGAALKLGQILSIQDSNIVSPQLVKAFERVRQAADYMPDWQVERVMVSELGPNWREHLKSFDQKPFAAASIGQVHRAILLDGTEVAIKIQYPGVAKSIESDIDNLVGMLKVWDVFPKGFFIDNVVKVAKRELAWEVDYIREAEYAEKYGEMVAKYKEYRTPRIIKEMTTKKVLTSEFLPGIPLDKCFELSYDHRKFIAEATIRLCFRELFEFHCMQTDPNWSNFLYDTNSRQLMLIDFGSTRFYSRKFIENYKKIIKAAADDQPQKVLEYSREMGFLTGYESKQMEDAHVNAVMILGEMFRCKEEFNFGRQDTTKRIANLVPTMVAHRLIPPPEEIYSIHRKLSGVFLLCARLNIKMNCRNIYEDILDAD